MYHIKWLAPVLAAVLLLPTLVGCSDRQQQQKDSAPPPPPPPADTAPAEEEPKGFEEEYPLPGTPAEPEIFQPKDSRTAPALSSDFAAISGLENNPKGWGPGGPVDADNRSQGAVAYQDLYGKYNADFIAPNANDVFLTFDEGYEQGFTPAILDVLKDKNCPAVFFVTMDYAKRQPELVQRMIDEGHVVGGHSVTHPADGMPTLPLDKQAEELTDLHLYVRENFGYEMNLFRFPAGIFSEQSLALVQQMGYRSVFWSFAYKDWLVDAQPNEAESLAHLNAKMHPGAIYLLHAVSQTNTNILGDFIDDTREAGFTFASYPSGN